MADLEAGIEQAVRIIQGAKYVGALSGAGISVESGIPPFRGPGGLWTRFGEPPLDGYQRFLADPKGFWEGRLRGSQGPGREMGQTIERAQPNPAHHAIAELERMGVLRFLITQNVDNLHRAAGSKNLIEIHGNFLLLRCIGCHSRFSREEISLDVLPPRCPRCGGIIKPDGVAFGEPIPPDALSLCQQESRRCDCMLVVGTSAVVYPAAGFAHQVKLHGGSLIEVNLYESDLTPLCQVSLRGQCGEVMPKLVAVIRGCSASA